MRALIVTTVLALTACATAPSPAAAPACVVSQEDRAWIDASIGAWFFSAREITGVATQPIEAVFFDERCVLTGANAFTAERAEGVVWSAHAHNGQITLPDGQTMPAGVTSFASAEGGRAFFVMSTPSVWRAAGVSNDGLGLEAMMTAVLLHEATHVAQAQTFGARIGTIVEANNLPDDFNDDSIQQRFGANAEFAASVERETELLFQAVAAPDQATARRLAREARDLMRARRARWFTGADAYLADAEDVWLSFEGTGQWLGYQWLVHLSGGGAEMDAALAYFARRGRWWSQKEGAALALVVGRLADFDWMPDAFGGSDRTLTQMLDAALGPE
ncbi:MAG: hypothetical protein R3C27_09885 [Hyphomonadaceae bacterium]